MIGPCFGSRYAPPMSFVGAVAASGRVVWKAMVWIVSAIAGSIVVALLLPIGRELESNMRYRYGGSGIELWEPALVSVGVSLMFVAFAVFALALSGFMLIDADESTVDLVLGCAGFLMGVWFLAQGVLWTVVAWVLVTTTDDINRSLPMRLSEMLWPW